MGGKQGGARTNLKRGLRLRAAKWMSSLNHLGGEIDTKEKERFGKTRTIRKKNLIRGAKREKGMSLRKGWNKAKQGKSKEKCYRAQKGDAPSFIVDVKKPSPVETPNKKQE